MAKGNCGFCGGEFDNVFEAVDHLQDEFAPKFVVGPQVKLDLADLFYEFYTSGNEKTKKLAEEAYSSLYIAEKRPEKLVHLLTNHRSILAEEVYSIVTEDSWKLAGRGL